MCKLPPIQGESILNLDTASVLCYDIRAGHEKSMSGKEVGHDTQRGLVVPMGVSSSELSGGVGRG